MRTSEAINEISGALVKAQAALKPAPKDTKNDFFKSRYADLASVWEACRGPLTDNGLAVIQSAETVPEGVAITTRLQHTTGQFYESTLTLHPTKNDPQGVGSAITYGRRYGLSAMVGIVADEDDDGNAASAPPKRQEKAAEKKPEPTMSPEQKAFNEWAAPHLVQARLSRDQVVATLKEVGGDYAAARAKLEQLDSMKPKA